MAGQSWGRRCDLGCESWPDSDDYNKCPLCGQETTRYSNLTPLPAEEARSMVAHIKFEENYAARCDRLGITSDGPVANKKTGEPVPFEDDRVWTPTFPKPYKSKTE